VIEAQREPVIGPPGSPGYRIAHGEDVVSIADLAENEATRHASAIQTLVGWGVHSYVAVALRKEERLLGAIAIYRLEVRPFTDKEIALLQNFAAQAVIAMENARLLTETREALQQQTATAEVLQVINRSPGDLEPVFQAIVEKAHTLCSAVCGSLQLWDGEKFRGVAMRGFSEAMAEGLRQGYIPGPNHPCRSLLEGEHIAHCADLAQIDDPVTRAGGVTLGGVGTILFVALRKDDALLGQIVAARREVRPFTESEIALVENFAAQAVIAMENARLLTETREALEQQTATAEVLQVINSSPGDLAPVFDAMLERALRLCDAAYGNLLSYDGEQLHPVAVRGDPRLTDRLPRQGSFRPGPGTTNYRIIMGERIVHVPDAADDEPYRQGDPIRRALVEIGKCRALLSVALRKDDAVLGVIHVYRIEPRPFTDKQIALLQNFAAQAVIAMENARLLTETREALEQQTATAEVLQVINSSPGDLSPVFDAILERAHSLCGIDFGALQLEDGGNFRSVAARGLSEALVELLRQPFQPVPGSPPSRLMGGERIVHIADMAELARSETVDARAQAVSQDGFRTGLFVPLRKDADLLGYIVAMRREVRLYSDKEIALLENFAAQAVIAIENARLLTETREALEQQTATAEVLGVINSSPGDLTPVFDAMLEKATRLCQAPFGHLRTWDGERFHLGAAHGEPEFCEWFRQRGPIRPDRDAPRWDESWRARGLSTLPMRQAMKVTRPPRVFETWRRPAASGAQSG
jgi:GAF domain-containing protein